MKQSLLLTLLLLIGHLLSAQVLTVKGKVTDAGSGEELIGVNIMVKGSGDGAVTDLNGEYSIKASPQDVLVFSYIGYLNQERLVENQSILNVALEPDVKTLSEVVVVGYGVQRKSDLTGAISSIDSDELTKVPSNNAMQALQGKVAGVQIANASGAPGSAPVVRIRGVGTFGNAAPIYVVDGVILEDISYLSPHDIQSMEILKDASATAIYGSRGANGVVLVTTRQGRKGDHAPVINFSSEYSIQQLGKKIDLLNGQEFAQVVNDIRPGTYNNVDALPNTDWQDLLYQPAPIQNHQVSIAGSSNKLQYYMGVGYFDQQGIVPGSRYERVTLRLNNTFQVSNHFRLGNNISVTPYRQQNAFGGAPFAVYRAQPIIEPYTADGSYSEVPGVGNVLAAMEYTNNADKALRSVSSFYGEADIVKGLTLRSSFGVDMEYKKNTTFTPEFFVSPQQQNSMSRLNKFRSDRLSWLWENTLNYQKEFDKHRINALGGYTMQQASSEFFSLGAENIIRDAPEFWYLNPDNINGNLVQNNVFLDQNYAMTSYLFRLNYVYNDKYLLTATYRRDGSSKFREENRFGDFPSIAVGWNLSNESFIQNIDLISNLKLRTSWGIIGNEKINYRRQFSGVLNGVGVVLGPDETLYPGSSYGVSGNEHLTWESTYQTDIGLEFGFFNDQLMGEVDYYHRITKDILIDLPVPGYLGNGVGAAITYNAGEVLNKGIEYSLSWNSQVGELRYRVGTVGTTIHNEALKVMGIGGPGDRLFNGAQTTATRPGLPLGAFYGYQTDGIFQNPEELAAYPHRSDAGVGDLRFVDVNGDGVISADDRTFLGSPIPKFIYGLNFELSYKGVDVSTDLQGQYGNKIFNAKETVRPDLYNFEQHVFNRWTGEGTSTIEPRATAGGYNWLPSSRFIHDGSFVRLRNLTVGYTIPSALSERAKMKTARVFVRGTNLVTLTKFTGYSPEVASESVLNNGIDYSTYPVPTIYSVGLNITF